MIELPFLSLSGRYEDRPFVSFKIEVPIRTEVDGQLSRFRFHFNHVLRLTDNLGQVCYFFQDFDIQSLKLFDPNILDSPSKVKIDLIDLIVDRDFAEGYYFNLYQESLSESAFEYWQNVQTLLIRTGNMFEAPVGKLEGNFSSSEPREDVFGYFYATTQRLYRLYISPEFAGNPVLACPSGPDPSMQNRDREDCIFFNPNTTLEKPAFWVE